MGNTKAERAYAILEGARGRIVGARFVKRTNGEVRDMNCRAGVTKYRRGGELAFNPLEKGLYPVFDMQKNEYRFITLDAVIQLRVDGTTYDFAEDGTVSVNGAVPENAHLLGVRKSAIYEYDSAAGF